MIHHTFNAIAIAIAGFKQGKTFRITNESRQKIGHDSLLSFILRQGLVFERDFLMPERQANTSMSA